MGRMKDKFIELQNLQRDKIEEAEAGNVHPSVRREVAEITIKAIDDSLSPKITYGVVRVEAGDTVGQGQFIANGLNYADARRLAELQPAEEGVVTIWVPDNYKQHLPKEED